MAEPDGLLLYYPDDARPAFADEDSVRRLGRQAGILETSRVLTLGMGAGPGPLVVAKELGATVIAVEATEAAAKALGERVKAAGLSDRVAVKHGALARPPVGEAEFDAIYVDARLPARLQELLSGLRRYLAPRGKLILVYPVRVGRHQNAALLRHWEQALGEPLVLPREALQVVAKSGFEPQLVETLEDPALDELYKDVERALEGAGGDGDERLARVREEVALFRGQGGRSTVSFAALVGRRREPGEKPPASRSE